MKHRFLVAIAGGLFLTTSSAISPVKADTTNLAFTFPALQGIQLTPSQVQQISVLSQQTLAEVRSLLTPRQRLRFDRSLATGVGLKKSLMVADLSLSQQWQLRKQLVPKQQQIDAILTPAQLQQARNNINAQS